MCKLCQINRGLIHFEIMRRISAGRSAERLLNANNGLRRVGSSLEWDRFPTDIADEMPINTGLVGRNLKFKQESRMEDKVERKRRERERERERNGEKERKERRRRRREIKKRDISSISMERGGRTGAAIVATSPDHWDTMAADFTPGKPLYNNLIERYCH